MDRTTYADPAVAALVNDRFVPIRVNADRRPDISDRYSLGGWPTTAFLTTEGEVIGGGTYVDRRSHALGARARGRGVQVAARGVDDAPRVQRRESPDDRHRPSARARISPRHVFDSFDAEHGGFGTAPKFPLTAPLELALDMYRETAGPCAGAHRRGHARRDGMGRSVRRASTAGSFAAPRRATGMSRTRRSCSTSTPACCRIYVEASRDAADRALSRAGGGRAALRADVAGRSSRWRLGGIAAGRPRLLCRGRWTSAAPAPLRQSTACSTPGGMRDGVGHAPRGGAARRHRARRVRAEVARAHRRRVLQPGRRNRALPGRPSVRCAGSSTIRLRWPPRTSTPMRRPATSSTR